MNLLKALNREVNLVRCKQLNLFDTVMDFIALSSGLQLYAVIQMSRLVIQSITLLAKVEDRQVTKATHSTL